MTNPILLKGGNVVDGTGAAGFLADVAISDGRITAIGQDLAADRGARVIDVAGLVVAPGFIDIHTHSDMSAIRDPACASKVRQGVTTDVTGNCGKSPFPISNERLDTHRDFMGISVGSGEPDLSWTDVAGYAQHVDDHPTAINLALLVGHGTLRTAVMGLDERAPSPSELALMQKLLSEQLEQGAVGFSTGLTVVPGSYADEDELVELVKVVARHDAVYSTHTRGIPGRDFGGVELAVATATAAGARLQFSHAAINNPALWGRASDITAIIGEARSSGLDVMFDVYPYDASSSAMTQYLPTWVQEGGTEAMRARVSDPAVYDRAITELRAGFWGIPWSWDRVQIAGVDSPDDWAIGLTVEEAARRAGREPAEWALQLCLDHGNRARVVLFYRTEEDMKTFLAHPLSMVGSDGHALPFDLEGAQPHPRSFGTYPRIFGRYVREQGLLTLEEAVRKCTSAVAERIQLRDRGFVRQGMVADLVVFDPNTIIDRATFSEPGLAPVGVEHVVVGGEMVVEGNEQTDRRPGRVLRRRR